MRSTRNTSGHSKVSRSHDAAAIINIQPLLRVSEPLGVDSTAHVLSLLSYLFSLRQLTTPAHFLPRAGRTAPLVIRVGEDDELRAAAALRWGLDPELLRGK